jgi:hypothetical protein
VLQRAAEPERQASGEHRRDDGDSARLRIVADESEGRERRERAVEAVEVLAHRGRTGVLDDVGDHIARQRADQQRAGETWTERTDGRHEQRTRRGVPLQDDLADTAREAAQRFAGIGTGKENCGHAMRTRAESAARQADSL